MAAEGVRGADTCMHTEGDGDRMRSLKGRMVKRRTTMADGRYLIYYSFERSGRSPEPGQRFEAAALPTPGKWGEGPGRQPDRSGNPCGSGAPAGHGPSSPNAFTVADSPECAGVGHSTADLRIPRASSCRGLGF